MRWLLEFLWGVVAHHVGTKILALLLAVLLFVFVQQAGQGTKDISEIILRFSLAEELKGEWVLLTDSVTLTEITIRGKRSTVNALARDYNLDNTRRVTITEAFRAAHAKGNRIDVTSKLFAAIESQDVEIIKGLNGETVRLDRLARHTFDVVLGPDQDDKTELAGDNPYQTLDGNRVRVGFSIDRVTIDGPRAAFEGIEQNPKLFVIIPSLDGALRRYESDKEEPTVALAIDHVDWKPSGIDPSYLEHIVITDPTLMTDKQFEQVLRIQFKVREQIAPGTLDIPILERRPLQGGKDLGNWKSLSSLVNDQDIKNARVNLPVRMPGALAKRIRSLESHLVLVLDLTRAEGNETELRVPIYLSLRDRSKGDLADLRRIRIDGNPVVTFGK